MSRPRVKVCGVTRRTDAEAAAAAGAALLGVVLAPGGPRTVSAEAAAALLHALPVERVGVFVDASLAELCRTAEVVGLDVLQLHGDESPGRIAELRGAGPWKLWKAVRPRSADQVAAAIECFAPHVDALLIDGWSAAARGGTGTRFPWEALEAHRGRIPAGCAVVVAGGLRAENVAEAAARLRPDVLDVSSGVEAAPGIKDAARLDEFFTVWRSLPEHGPTPDLDR